MKPITKYKYDIKEISKDEALEMIKKYHYSNSLPRLNKHFVGFFINNQLVGVVTLGWGTQPLGTIKKLFPSLQSKDYYEIGRMCMTEEMPRNSESQMLSQLCKWLKKTEPKIKILFTWADGMLGKTGYVYQASSFIYCGYILTTMYMKDGVKIHPRQTRAIFKTDENDKRLTIRPTIQQMKEYGIDFYKGKQFRYIKFLCSKVEKKRLIKESLVSLKDPYPKENSLLWKIKDLKTGKWVNTGIPPYITDNNKAINEENNTQIAGQMNIYDFLGGK